MIPGTQQKTQPSDEAFVQIDWEGHYQAVGLFHITYHYCIEFLQKLLPVGRQVHRYNPGIYRSQLPINHGPSMISTAPLDAGNLSAAVGNPGSETI
jgi:hypothetical protein